MFKIKVPNTFLYKIKGLYQSSIPYEVRVSNGNWSNYFGKYENQKWGLWDSDSCWCLASVNCLEDQLEWLSKNGQFTTEAIKFFTDNGYIDSDGDFSISERYFEILGGFKDNGGYAEAAWKLMETYGCIPRSMLTYTEQQANSFGSQQAFVNDYFNPTVVTSQMIALSRQFLKYVKIQHQVIGYQWTTPNPMVLQNALKQAPLQIGIPIDQGNNFNWNNTFVQYRGRTNPDHEVELYALNPDGTYPIFDQYRPNLKTLSKDYLIVFCTQGVVTAIPQAKANPVVQDSYWNMFWSNVNAWFNGKILPYPNVQIGKK